jgi:hypothetical protein
MSIKFIHANQKEIEIRYKDVLTNQFFVYSNCLYQKYTEETAVQITNEYGSPYSDVEEMDAETVIDRLIPHVNQIEF